VVTVVAAANEDDEDEEEDGAAADDDDDEEEVEDGDARLAVKFASSQSWSMCDRLTEDSELVQELAELVVLVELEGG